MARELRHARTQPAAAWSNREQGAPYRRARNDPVQQAVLATKARALAAFDRHWRQSFNPRSITSFTLTRAPGTSGSFFQMGRRLAYPFCFATPLTA